MKIRSLSPRAAQAFTLIEIVIVLTIISILAAGSIYMLKGNVDVAKETRVDSDLQNISTQLLLYEARNMRLPTTEQGLKALVEKPTTEPIPEKFTQLLEDVPKDPWGMEYKYRYPAQKSKKPYDIYTMGKDGVEGNEDDIGNWKAGATK
ncbi:MAG: type II secretion system major pseudopilin GspG [Prosthecobacter sp.]|nr:type II secretion system major pseudopilin GspG [Prosthecobacter sp.]